MKIAPDIAIEWVEDEAVDPGVAPLGVAGRLGRARHGDSSVIVPAATSRTYVVPGLSRTTSWRGCWRLCLRKQSLAARLGITPPERAPNPGDEIAKSLGCTCPRDQARYGIKRDGRDWDKGGTFAVLNGCPLHDDPEVFAEQISFVETRDYVRVIQRNEDIYRALYGREVSDRSEPQRPPDPPAAVSGTPDQQM